ncbi:MAG: DUF2846 domain-containing protein [Gammaproteobacteria bacterium]|nr:DUF2846 domain-containing protein [Gammaproteobacteria bacterium]MDT8371148.1 DUF2846 domain-containing protein [Gammaproteobacteria bacterium]
MIFQPLITQLLLIILLIVLTMLSGCASIPLTNYGQDALLKTFPEPAVDSAGLYIFRDTRRSGLLRKTIKLDGEVLGDTAMFVYFYKYIEPGRHTVTTQTEFGESSISFDALASKNTYIRQNIITGVFVASAELEIVDEKQGKAGVLKCYLAQEVGEQEKLKTRKSPFSSD